MSWFALWLYASWTLALLIAIAALRFHLSITNQHPANGFKPAGDDVSPFSGRLCRAHANCYENLPIVIAVLVVAAQTGQVAQTDGLALPLVFARIAQSSTHLVSTSVSAVTLRFAFFGLQSVIVAYWLVVLVPR